MLARHMRMRHNQGVVEVVVTAEFRGWYEALSARDQRPVAHAVGLLEEMGVDLGFPHSSAIEGSKVAMRELRVKAHGKQVRIFYVFDVERQAVLLVAGDKVGKGRFYEVMVPRAEKLWDAYLAETKKGRKP
jgi:hypothetical protein